jgi:hypothetical protein
MSHTIYLTRIILRPLSALFGLQFMLPMEKSVTFTAACANDIIPNELLARLLTKRKKEVMLEYTIQNVSMDTDTLLNEKRFTQFTPKYS